MLRSARLIAEEIKGTYVHDAKVIEVENGYKTVLTYPLEIKPGDIMTGWEIMAGLPLEEQNDFEKCLDSLPKAITENMERMTDKYTDDVAFILGCCALYRWNDEAWEVVE